MHPLHLTFNRVPQTSMALNPQPEMLIRVAETALACLQLIELHTGQEIAAVARGGWAIDRLVEMAKERREAGKGGSAVFVLAGDAAGKVSISLCNKRWLVDGGSEQWLADDG